VSARISSVVRVTAKGHRFSVGFSEIKDSLQRRRTSENSNKAKFALFGSSLATGNYHKGVITA
jgi:hypothetical protein